MITCKTELFSGLTQNTGKKHMNGVLYRIYP